jgi:hypothetical protein
MSFPCQATRCGTSAPAIHPRKFDSEDLKSLLFEKRSRFGCVEALSEHIERRGRQAAQHVPVPSFSGEYAKLSAKYLACRLVERVDCVESVDHLASTTTPHTTGHGRTNGGAIGLTVGRGVPFALTSRLFFKVWRTLLCQRSERSRRIEMILLTQIIILQALPFFVS